MSGRSTPAMRREMGAMVADAFRRMTRRQWRTLDAFSRRVFGWALPPSERMVRGKYGEVVFGKGRAK